MKELMLALRIFIEATIDYEFACRVQGVEAEAELKAQEKAWQRVEHFTRKLEGDGK